MERWPHQIRAFDETLAAIARGERCILVTSPTGGGKSRIICDMIEALTQQGWHAVLYTNRKLLIDQLVGVLDKHGIDHGVRAAEWSDEGWFEPVQISSLPTERSRVLTKQKWQIHGSGRQCIAIVDEAHLNAGRTARRIFQLHEEAGHARLGFTATPLDLGDIYDRLIVAGTNSELRRCGALVPCLHYGPDEPDLRHIGRIPLGQDLTESQNRKIMMTPTIFGRVWTWFDKLNPEHKPTILFAPGVPESIWFAERFVAKGVTVAHIDGKDVWVNGKLYRSSRQARADVLAGSKDGTIKVLCNRFVLREGIDAPWLAHGIFATVFGSLQSYLQSGGRLLRGFPGLESVTLQDHGGNWWRHGSLNADREWRLEDTCTSVAGLREDRLRNKKDTEPIRCPQCARILSSLSCQCGWEAKAGRKSRPVVSIDGELIEMHGDIYRPRRIDQRPDAVRTWEKVYYRAKNAGKTFRQAEALYAKENDWNWPPRTLPLMPIEERDWHRKVKDVPFGRLIPRQQVAVTRVG
jgi:superfamily II DNA or RNA helicase